MIDTSERLNRWRPHRFRNRMSAPGTAPPTSTPRRRVARFARHYLVMCAAMCVGFALGDLVYFWVAGRLGPADPFTDLPVLSLAVVTVAMTAPMAGWMAVRGMPRQATAEMCAAMGLLALGLLVLGAVGAVPMGDLALLAHGLMMPAMLVPMLLRLDVYAGPQHYAAS